MKLYTLSILALLVLSVSATGVMADLDNGRGACPVGGACTPGNTCCWEYSNTGGTAKTATATCGNGGTWGASIKCSPGKDSACTKTGPGGKCAKPNSVVVSLLPPPAIENPSPGVIVINGVGFRLR